jgi:uncharacterized protein YndB with AHSA1/START domain
MKNPLSLELEGETVVIVKRFFAAPPEMIYQSHTDPKLVKQWCLGPEGWTMPVCIYEARPGGKIRCEWSDGKGGGFFLTGEFVEVDPPHRTVHIERMHLPDPTPDNRIETRFTKQGTGTLMIMRMNLPDAQTREMMLSTGMEEGMEASYVRLDQQLA